MAAIRSRPQRLRWPCLLSLKSAGCRSPNDLFSCRILSIFLCRIYFLSGYNASRMSEWILIQKYLFRTKISGLEQKYLSRRQSCRGRQKYEQNRYCVCWHHDDDFTWKRLPYYFPYMVAVCRWMTLIQEFALPWPTRNRRTQVSSDWLKINFRILKSRLGLKNIFIAFGSWFTKFKSGKMHLQQRSPWHYIDVIMTTMASQITSLTVVYAIVYSGADQRKHKAPGH